MKAFIIILCFSLFLTKDVVASENDLINLAETHNNNAEYYNAVTEIMRYQYLYPNGVFYPKSMLILSEAYYKGGNYDKTISILSECSEKYRNTPEGEKAFYNIGYVRLVMGSPYFAFRTYQEYQYLYKDGIYTEDVSRDLCYALTLMKDLKGGKRAIRDYKENYSDGKYLQQIKDLQILIDEEINKPKKSLLISVLGSIVIPGFGHFYTGKYEAGIFSLVSNAIFIYLFYNGCKEKDKTQMIVFGFAEFTFYQYSLYSSIRNVYEYNNSEKFYKTVRLSAAKEF